MVSSNVLQPVPCVVPVVDYEPPVLGGPPALPPVPAPAPRPAPPPARPSGGPCPDPAARAATAFADAAVRRVLETIDRRRPLSQLRPLLAAGLVESLLAAADRHGGGGVARLSRLRVRMTAPGAAEVAASYARGDRVHALACRIEAAPGPGGPRWQVVALHLG